MKVSVIIKALNEEKNIERALESALAAVEAVGGGEVILADSLSTDRTIELAEKYPVKIVQLNHAKDRSCGIGAELGRQVATGKYLYILDADMEFCDGFLSDAIEEMEKDAKLAGVAGTIEEMLATSVAFKERYKRKNSGLIAGESVTVLNMGGLYRASALEDVGYFTNRNLRALEEYELGARLKVQGWRLTRLDRPGVKHYGHDVSSFRLLAKRVKSGYIFGIGELIRSAVGKKHFSFILRNLHEFKVYSGYLVWMLVLLFTLIAGVFFHQLLPFIVVLIMPFAAMVAKKKNINSGVYSVVASSCFALGMLFGFFKAHEVAPDSPIDYRVVKA